MKKFSNHLPHYLSLLGILTLGVVGFALSSYNRALQIFICVLIAVSYVVWGYIHHKIHKDFEVAILIEYIAVALLGLITVFSLIFRS